MLWYVLLNNVNTKTFKYVETENHKMKNKPNPTHLSSS